MMERRASNARNIVVRQLFAREGEKLRKAEQRWCPQFTTNLVVSTDEEQELKTWVPGVQTAIVPNGVDTEYFSPRSDPGGKTLLFCGGLDWYPNNTAMAFFFDAIWPRLARQIKDVEIHVVGRMPPKWLHRLSATDHRIHVTGFVNDVRPYFRKATAYVCPIMDGGGTRLKILDALAMGMPLIGTSFACSGLPLEDDRHVLLAETPEDFVRQIELLLGNRDLRMRLSRAGREVVERMYSWHVIGKTLVEAYENASSNFSIGKAS